MMVSGGFQGLKISRNMGTCDESDGFDRSTCSMRLIGTLRYLRFLIGLIETDVVRRKTKASKRELIHLVIPATPF